MVVATLSVSVIALPFHGVSFGLRLLGLGLRSVANALPSAVNLVADLVAKAAGVVALVVLSPLWLLSLLLEPVARFLRAGSMLVDRCVPTMRLNGVLVGGVKLAQGAPPPQPKREAMPPLPSAGIGIGFGLAPAPAPAPAPASYPPLGAGADVAEQPETSRERGGRLAWEQMLDRSTATLKRAQQRPDGAMLAQPVPQHNLLRSFRDEVKDKRVANEAEAAAQVAASSKLPRPSNLASGARREARGSPGLSFGGGKSTRPPPSNPRLRPLTSMPGSQPRPPAARKPPAAGPPRGGGPPAAGPPAAGPPGSALSGPASASKWLPRTARVKTSGT